MGIKVEKMDTPDSPWVVNSRMVGPIIVLSLLLAMFFYYCATFVQTYGNAQVAVLLSSPFFWETTLSLVGMIALILLASALLKRRFNATAVALSLGFAEILLAIYFLYISGVFNIQLSWNNGTNIFASLIAILLVAYAPKKILERPYRIKQAQRRNGYSDAVVVKITNGNKWTYSYFLVQDKGGVYYAYNNYGVEAEGNSLREAINREIATMEKMLNDVKQAKWGIDWNKPLHDLIVYDPKKHFDPKYMENFAEFGTPLNAQKYSPEEYDGNDNFDEEGSYVPTPQPSVYGKPAGAKPIKEKNDDDYACYS